MNIFISHIHEDLAIAQAIKIELKKCFGGQIDLFLAHDIPLGSNWFEKLREALTKADLILALFSPHSIKRPWINIEAGYGIMAHKHVIPICCLGLKKTELPVVYGLKEAMHIDDMVDVCKLLEGIASSTSVTRSRVIKATRSWRASIPTAISSSNRKVQVDIDSADYFHIVNKASGGCLDIEDWASTNGANIIQYPYHGGDNQLWQISKVDGFYYNVISKHSHKCLEVKDSSDAGGAAIDQKDYEGYANQQWDFTVLQNGEYKIAAKHSGKCLSVQGSDRSPRGVIQDCWHDLPVQRWWLKVSVNPI